MSQLIKETGVDEFLPHLTRPILINAFVLMTNDDTSVLCW